MGKPCAHIFAYFNQKSWLKRINNNIKIDYLVLDQIIFLDKIFLLFQLGLILLKAQKCFKVNLLLNIYNYWLFILKNIKIRLISLLERKIY
jgi:hypothetical protein